MVKPIDVSNTTRSTFKTNRHRKYDANQAERHDYGEAHCVVCNKVFTKHHYRISVCSKECKTEKRRAYERKYREENHGVILAKKRRYREKNREEIREKARKYHQENREELLERKRKHYQENRDERLEYARKYRAKKKEMNEWNQ